MAQGGKRRQTAPAADAWVVLSLDPVQVVDAPLQLGGAVTGGRLGPPLPCALAPLYHAVVLRPPRWIPHNPDPQPEEPEGQFGGQISGRAPGRAVVDPDARGESPAAKRLPQVLLGLGRRHRVPAPEGGKSRSTRPRR